MNITFVLKHQLNYKNTGIITNFSSQNTVKTDLYDGATGVCFVN